jgi:hypothetical protein
MGLRRVEYFISGSSRLSGELGEYGSRGRAGFIAPRNPSRQPVWCQPEH